MKWETKLEFKNTLKFYRMFFLSLIFIFFLTPLSLLRSGELSVKEPGETAVKEPGKTAVKTRHPRKGAGSIYFEKLTILREFIQAASFKSMWVKGGRVRVLIMPNVKWIKAKQAVFEYRKILKSLARLPLASFLYRPRAFVTASEFLSWGRKNAVAIDSVTDPGFDGLLQILTY